MQKAPDAFRTISEVAEDLDLPQHVLRFWETRFSQIKPMKRGGGRRYYRPDDINLLRGIRHLLYGEGYTIKGVQRILKDQGVRFVTEGAVDSGETPSAPQVPVAAADEKETPQTKVEISTPPIAQANVAPESSSAPVAQVNAPQGEQASAPSSSVPFTATPPAPEPTEKQTVNLASSFDTPESLVFEGNDKSSGADGVEGGPSARFTVTHNVPTHLVDAITTGPSVLESAPALEPEEVEERPFDVLPEYGEEKDSAKTLGRGLLKRFKTSAGQGSPERVDGDLDLSGDDAHRLQETLIDLLECKRLLDQIR